MKKIPMRRCLGCNISKPKKELVRIVRTPDGRMEMDPTGRANGRGAYICGENACFLKALKTKRLERSLGTELSKEVIEEMSQRAGVKSGEE